LAPKALASSAVYLTNIIAPNHDSGVESLLFQRQLQILDLKIMGSISKTEQPVHMEGATNAKVGSTCQPPAIPSVAHSQSILEKNGTRDCGSVDPVSTERRRPETKMVRKEKEKKSTWATTETAAQRSPSKSDLNANPPQKKKHACSRRHAVSLTASPDLTRTEQQVLSSRSNYEILRSGMQPLVHTAFPASLQASINNKRTQHRREEKMRRDRMKRALEALADIIQHRSSSQAAVGKAGSMNSNRAETVEDAIEYIRGLHKKYGVDANTKK
jgi:hypothetical protein